ncbi:MAG: hypothetical protein OER88_14060, partial [Planctomycetota bacterium]|nr:hypothetical protein [Planctomycetota bacterium]
MTETSSSDRPLRLLFLNYEYPPLGGGGGVVTCEVAEALAGRAEVTVITSQWDDLAEDAIENGVRMVRVPVKRRKERAAASLISLLSFVPASLRAGR